MSSSRFSKYDNSCLTFLCFSLLLAATFPKCHQLLVQYTIYKWVYWMRTDSSQNKRKISNPKIFHYEMIFTSDEPHTPHWCRNTCNSIAKNSAETNKESSSISDISQDIEEVRSTSSHSIWTNSSCICFVWSKIGIFYNKLLTWILLERNKRRISRMHGKISGKQRIRPLTLKSIAANAFHILQSVQQGTPDHKRLSISFD